MKTVLIPTRLEPVAAERLAAAGYQVVQDDVTPLAEQAAAHPDTHAMIVRSEKVTPAVMDLLPALKVIVRAGAGYDTIDTRYARRKGIDVMNTPGANANAVAEEVIGLMLADARHIVPADASTRAGKWEKKKFMGREIAGKTVGIVGLGNIGRLVAKRLAGFECALLGYDPAIATDRARELNVKVTDLETLFAKSDFITLHLPENEATRGMVGARLLALVKQGATIVNCARAGIVDQAALRNVKSEKRLRFLNDVYPKDEEGPKAVADIADLMLPHLGASTLEANENAARRAAEQLIDLDLKGIASFVVNRDIPGGLDRAYCDLAYSLAKLCSAMVGRGTAIQSIETSLYGSLAPFSDWLLAPIVAGLSDDFDATMDFKAAREYLEEVGIEYVNRRADPKKGFEASITIDLTGSIDASTLRRASVRGTVAEGVRMVSRIDEFDRLYFEPSGHNAIFVYDDRPGVIGTIGAELAGAGVNIHDMRNPHDPDSNRSLAIMKISRPADGDLLHAIRLKIDAVSAFGVTL